MNAVAPTMLSSSNVPQPEFACWWPRRPSAASRAAYSARLSPFMSRCCQSMLTLTLSMPLSAERVDHVQRHPDVAHEDLHRRLGVLVLEEELDAVLRAPLRGLPDPVDEPRPALLVRRLERVVVALDPRPDDEVARRARPAKSVASRVLFTASARVVRVRRDEPASSEAGIEMESRRDAVDAVAVERVADVVEVLRGLSSCG